PHRHGERHLLLHHLPQQLAADREVGVPEPGSEGRQPFGHPVGPAPEAPIGAGIVESFGETVPDRDEGAVHLTPPAAPRWLAAPARTTPSRTRRSCRSRPPPPPRCGGTPPGPPGWTGGPR